MTNLDRARKAAEAIWLMRNETINAEGRMACIVADAILDALEEVRRTGVWVLDKRIDELRRALEATK